MSDFNYIFHWSKGRNMAQDRHLYKTEEEYPRRGDLSASHAQRRKSPVMAFIILMLSKVQAGGKGVRAHKTHKISHSVVLPRSSCRDSQADTTKRRFAPLSKKRGGIEPPVTGHFTSA